MRRKLKRILLATLTLLTMSVGALGMASCFSYTELAFTMNGPNSWSVTGKGSTSSTKGIILPSTIWGQPVTAIFENAFENYNISSIKIPESITSIGKNAFRNCDYLTSIDLPDSIVFIGENAFRDCDNLTSIVIPDSVTFIGEGVFDDCDGLTSITVDENNKNYSSQDGILYNKDKTELIHIPQNCKGDVTIPDGIIEIGERAFGSRHNLTSVIIPDSVTHIGDYAFYECNNLTSLEIPDSVTHIGDYAFYECNNLTSLEIPDSVTHIGDYAFYECNNLTSLEIPDSVTHIGDSSFGSFNSENKLKSIKIGDGVISIGKYAFTGCAQLTNIELGMNVTTIDDGAFYRCPLINIKLPDSVTFIGKNAFYCENLKNVYINNIAMWCNISFANVYSNPLFYADNLYIGNQLVTQLNIPDGVTSIGNYAFYSYEKLKTVIIPEGVTTIGKESFYKCDNLTNISIPNSIIYIGEGALSSSPWTGRLPNLQYHEEDRAYYLGNNNNPFVVLIFENNDKKTAYTIHQNTKIIYDRAFNHGAIAYPFAMTSLEIHANVTCIGHAVFKDTHNLKTITVAEENSHYKSQNGNLYTKDGKELLKYAIGKDASSFQIPDTVTNIRECSFYSSDNLKSIEIPESVTTIGDYAFYDCISLISIAIPDSVTTIGNYVFNDCASLTSVIIGESVTEIGDKAFDYCDSLTDVYYRSTLEEWNKISIGDDNEALTSATCYYYSETKLMEEGNYWHYDENGEIAVW